MAKLEKQTRLEKLKELEANLYELMQHANSRSMASLARQYRETIREIEDIEVDNGDLDEIAQIIKRREAK